MTADIAKMKALALAATPGPWHAPGMGEIHAENHDEIAQILYHTGDDEDMQCGTDADAEFIAACRTTVPELIAEVERLRTRFEYIEDRATTTGGGHGFTVSFFVPVDEEDIGCGIDAAIAHTKAAKENA